jgi:hypothetical protein
LIGKGPNVINLAPPSNKKMKHQYDFYRAHRAGGAFPLAGICPWVYGMMDRWGDAGC